MKYLQGYDLYRINESFDYQLLLEDKTFNFWRNTQDKTIKTLGLQFYFVGTFQMAISVLYPVIDALMKNSNIPNVTPTTVVLMTIFSIAQILKMKSEDVKKVKDELEKENMMEITSKVQKSLESIFKIFSFVSRSFGKVIDVFTDMLAYVALCVPVYSAILEIVSKEGLNLETLPQKVLVLGGGVAIFGLKNILQTVVDLVKNKIKFNKQI